MSVSPSTAKLDSQVPNDVNATENDNAGRALSVSPSASQFRIPPNFSRPIPSSPPATNPENVAKAPTAGPSISPGSRFPRPLPSVPGYGRGPSPQSSDQGGRGSGLGTRIIDDRDPDDIDVTLSHPQSRNIYGCDDDGLTSSAASDSELLYASAPSTPLRIPVGLEHEADTGGTSSAGSQITHETARRGLPERRVTVALGEAHQSVGEGAVTPKRAATIDFPKHGSVSADMLVYQVSGTPGSPDHSTVDNVSDAAGTFDGTELYPRKTDEGSGDGPQFPVPLIQEESTSVPHSWEPQHHLHPILLGVPISDMGGASSPSGDKENIPTTMPAVTSFPIPLHEQHGPAWKLHHPSNLHETTQSGEQSQSFEKFKNSPTLIAGTDLHFEPFLSPHAQMAANPSQISPVKTLDYAHDQALTYQEASNNSPFGKPPPPIAPLRISKQTQPSSSTSAIPVGAAVPTPPASSSSPDSPKGAKQGSGLSPVASPTSVSSTSKQGHSVGIRAGTGVVAVTETLPGSSDSKSTASVKRLAPSQSKVDQTLTVPADVEVARDTVPVLPGPSVTQSQPGSPQKRSNVQSRPHAQEHNTRPLPPPPSDHAPLLSPPPPPSSQRPIQAHPSSGPDTQTSTQPRTLAEEKAQYNAIAPASRSQYMNMLLALDDIPMIYNLLASFFTWILLAGFILFPGTFARLQQVDLGNGVGAVLVDRIVNLPLFVIAFVCTGVGIAGMGYLWWKWMSNYIWLVNKIFLPGLMNSLAGIISTLASVYGQRGEFRTSSIITISVTGGVFLACGVLVLFYGVWMLGRVKKRHVREVGIEKAGKHGEGVWAGFKERVGKSRK